MRILRRLIGTGLVLPLVALGGSLWASQLPDSVRVTAAPQQVVGEVGHDTAYQCCWVYWGGRWYCLPC
jgi:uncharacterized membrane protein